MKVEKRKNCVVGVGALLFFVCLLLGAPIIAQVCSVRFDKSPRDLRSIFVELNVGARWFKHVEHSCVRRGCVHTVEKAAQKTHS